VRFKIIKDSENPPNRRELIAFWIGLHWPWLVAILIGIVVGLWAGDAR
jgi:hypothetical protein